MSSNQKTYSQDFDGLIEHVKDVCTKHEARELLLEIEKRKKRRFIRKEYKKRLKDNHGSAEKIRMDLAEEYYGNADSFFHTVRRMTKQSEENYFSV